MDGFFDRVTVPPDLLVARIAISLPKPAARRGWRLRPWALGRILAAVAVVGFAIWQMADRMLLVSSLDGVLTAPLVELRAPLDGRVTVGAGVEPGAVMTRGQLLFTVKDSRVDESVRTDLQVRLNSIVDQQQSHFNQVAALQDLRTTLQTRTALHHAAMVRRFTTMVTAAAAQRDEAQVRVARARLELTRSRDLVQRGVQSRSRAEDIDSELNGAVQAVDRLTADLERTKTDLAAAQGGVNLGDSFADVPYSQQRIDEITLRLAGLASEADGFVRVRRELADRLTAELQRLSHLTRETVTSPSSGQMWALQVADGTWVARGGPLGSFADCSHAFVEATLPARGFSVVQSGAAVKVRMANTDSTVPGTVRSLHGGEEGSGGQAAKVERSRGLATVIVDVDTRAMDGNCQLGRAAKVLF